MTITAFDRDELVAGSIERTGLDDFGEPTWREGLDILLHDLDHEARLSDVGVAIVETDIDTYLRARLELTEWRRTHPEIAGVPIERPIVIVGQPRTGTTILYDLLAQDPDNRAPLTWEVDRPVPPPASATFDTDERIAEAQASIDMVDLVLPGFTDFHPMGAQLAQECVRITGSEFRSMIFPTQYLVPNYNRWLLHEADMAPAYRWHRQFLEHLQSAHFSQRWLLKSPAHLWSLEALVAEYPDAIIIQTHRDPLKVIASISALVAHLRSMASDHGTIASIAPGYAEDVLTGLDRSVAAREDATFGRGQVIDVHFTEFVADPMGTIAQIYRAMDLELSPSTATRMQDFLAAHPGDVDGSAGRYSFADTELDADALRERAVAYQEYFGVRAEPVR